VKIALEEKKNKKLCTDLHQANVPQAVGRRRAKLLNVIDVGKKTLPGKDALSRDTSVWHTLRRAA